MHGKPGRPKKDKQHSREPGVSVRLNENEARAIMEAIKLSGIRQSDWLRKALLYVASNGIRIT